MSAVSERLDEFALRRPEWAKGAVIVFPDGQRWHFYAPAPRCITEGGRTAVFWDFGVGFLDNATLVSLNRNFYRLLMKLARAVNERQSASAMLELAWFLLARSYLISQPMFEALMFEAGDTPPLWTAISAHVRKVIEDGQKALEVVIGR